MLDIVGPLCLVCAADVRGLRQRCLLEPRLLDAHLGDARLRDMRLGDDGLDDADLELHAMHAPNLCSASSRLPRNTARPFESLVRWIGPSHGILALGLGG